MNTPTGRWYFGRKGGFCYDADLEALLRLREDDPEQWYELRPHLKVRLAFYEGCKATYEDSLQTAFATAPVPEVTP